MEVQDNNLAVLIPAEGGSILDPSILPATGKDLFIYLFGGIGLYFLASFIAGLFIKEFNLTTTLIISILNFGCLAGSVYIFGILRKKISWKSLGVFPSKNILKYAVIGGGLAVAILPLRFLVGALGLWIETLIQGDITSLNVRENILSVGYDTWYGIVLMVIGVGVLAPIAEELFFRGLLYDWFRQKTGIVWGMLISSFLFGLAHYDSLAVVGSSFVMGLAMAYAFEKTRSLWIAIFMHVATNSGAVLLMALLMRFQEFLPQTLQY